MPQFETRITLPKSREEVFDFLVRTSNLIELIPPNSGMKVISAPEIIQRGSRLEFQANAFGQSLNIVHEVTELVTPERFKEVQLKGIFKSWVHEHVIQDESADQVVAIDRIEFEPPGGMLGFLVTKKVIYSQLESLFSHRHRQMRKVLG
jgi:ligand-binding SRPBCC domain-containing protein